MLLFGQMVCGIGPIFVIVFLREGNPFNLNITFSGIFSIMYLAVLGTVVSFWLYYWLLSRIESTKAMTIALVTPLVAVVCGNLFLGEKLRTQTIAGGALILASVGLIVFRKKFKIISDKSGAASV